MNSKSFCFCLWFFGRLLDCVIAQCYIQNTFRIDCSEITEISQSFPSEEIKSEFNKHPQLQAVLTISSKKYQKIPDMAFAGIDFFRLQVSYAVLAEISAGAFRGSLDVSELSLRGNKIHDLRFLRHIHGLKSLDLYSKKIRELTNDTFSGFHRLESLNLAINEISQIDQACFASLNLTHLDLSENRIKNLDTQVSGLAYLKQLNIGMNNMTSVGADAFRGLLNLQELFMNSNQFGIVKREMFGTDLANLENLFFYFSNIIEIQPDTQRDQKH
jgi:hypothetical protein